MSFKIDSGADVTTLDVKTYKSMVNPPDMRPTSDTLAGAGGEIQQRWPCLLAKLLGKQSSDGFVSCSHDVVNKLLFVITIKGNSIARRNGNSEVIF